MVAIFVHVDNSSIIGKTYRHKIRHTYYLFFYKIWILNLIFTSIGILLTIVLLYLGNLKCIELRKSNCATFLTISINLRIDRNKDNLKHVDKEETNDFISVSQNIKSRRSCISNPRKYV